MILVDILVHDILAVLTCDPHPGLNTGYSVHIMRNYQSYHWIDIQPQSISDVTWRTSNVMFNDFCENVLFMR